MQVGVGRRPQLAHSFLTTLSFSSYSKARRLMLQRLLQWAPVNFGSCLAQRLCTELSREDYLSVNADEVGIMLTKPGLLYNQALLDR